MLTYTYNETESSSAWIVRPMLMSDVDAVAAIELDTFRVPWPRDSFVRELTVNNTTARYLILERGGEAVGYAGVWLVFDEGHITNVAVKRGCRGMGGGTKLIRALIERSIECGLRFLTLEARRSNTAAHALYHKCGFIDIGYRKRYYEDNREDALVMTCLDLPAALERLDGVRAGSQFSQLNEDASNAQSIGQLNRIDF